MTTSFIVLLIALLSLTCASDDDSTMTTTTTAHTNVPESNIYYISPLEAFDDQEARRTNKNISAIADDGGALKNKNKKRKNSALNEAVQVASLQGLAAMVDLYERQEPEILRKGRHQASSCDLNSYILISSLSFMFCRRIS